MQVIVESAGSDQVQISRCTALPRPQSAHLVERRTIGVIRMGIAVHLVLARIVVHEQHLAARTDGERLRTGTAGGNRDRRRGRWSLVGRGCGVRISTPRYQNGTCDDAEESTSGHAVSARAHGVLNHGPCFDTPDRRGVRLQPDRRGVRGEAGPSVRPGTPRSRSEAIISPAALDASGTS